VALSFFAIVLEGAPFLLLGAIVSGLVDVFLPAGLIKDWLPKSKTQGVFAALGAGLIFPLCECGAMPIVQRLIRKGVPAAVATTYMLAAPALNPLALFSTYLAFRNQDPWLMVVLRFSFSFLVLLFLGFWLVRLRPENMLRAETVMGRTTPGMTPNPGLVLTPRPGLSRGPALSRHWGRGRRHFFHRVQPHAPRPGWPKRYSRAVGRDPPRATPLPLQHHRCLHHRRVRPVFDSGQDRVSRSGSAD
jgi:uncharacterized membrane protein YraQ (UPF0718 family)